MTMPLIAVKGLTGLKLLTGTKFLMTEANIHFCGGLEKESTAIKNSCPSWARGEFFPILHRSQQLA